MDTLPRPTLWQRAREQLGSSLRVRMLLGVGLPILAALTLLSTVHYWRERQLLADQARATAEQFGLVMVASLRHSMLINDAHMTRNVLGNLVDRRTFDRAQIVSLEGNVLLDSGPARPGELQHVAEPGCATCHRLAAEARPKSAVVTSDPTLLRVAVPIMNQPECAGCHASTAGHLGVLLVDVPMQAVWPDALQNLQSDLAVSAGLTAVLGLGLYGLVHRLVIRRVLAFRRPLAAYAAGDFDARLPVREPADEIGQLAQTFNHMADELERHARAERARSELRYRAIVEERDRIARELHDGLAQVLGYVQTKATAIRLLLARRETQAAEKQLAQLEEAARGLFVDVREAVLGLKMTSRPDARLATMLRDYAAHFSQLCELPVQVDIAPGIAQADLPAETEIQLLRIAQEALTNIRKHARAGTARVILSNGGRKLELRIEDDGCGFEPEHARASGRPHFGLGTMRERAEAIGAEFCLESRPGSGTQVLVRLPLRPAPTALIEA